MTNKFSFLCLFALFIVLAACSNDSNAGSEQKTPDQNTELNALNVTLEQLTDSITGRIKTADALAYIKQVEDFANKHSTETESAQQLYKAAEVARSVRAYGKAIEIYKRIETSFPNYDKAPKALFMQAFTYGEDLKQIDKAKALYEAFIQKYPEDDFVDDATVLLSTMGKSDEEIFQQLGKE